MVQEGLLPLEHPARENEAAEETKTVGHTLRDPLTRWKHDDAEPIHLGTATHHQGEAEQNPHQPGQDSTHKHVKQLLRTPYPILNGVTGKESGESIIKDDVIL